jgi:2-polyprenyl-3-methyl-5-hydroxy-6-metoxy-1,4-benzoquinol methylase
LQFRHPVDSNNFNLDFYQAAYQQDDGITTELLSKSELEQMLTTNFAASAKNVAPFVEIFQSIFKDKTYSLIDYGCSWGYMSYQFAKMGIPTQSFEISVPRAKYGNNALGLSIVSTEKELRPGADIFFSSHVIEHVPSVKEMVNSAKKLLKPDGFFIAECPNGSAAFRKRNASAFHHAWGLVHPSYLSDDFVRFTFADNPYLIVSSPYDLANIGSWDQKSQVIGPASGDQLLIIAKPNEQRR